MIIIISLIISLYILIISLLYIAYENVKTFKLTSKNSETRFSIIIPFRNEEDNINNLMRSINLIEYPKTLYEIILVDDDSNDNSVELIKTHLKRNSEQEISIIKNKRHSNSPKKDAIETAISKAKHEWILTTDADCLLPKLWLQSFDECISLASPKIIAAPLTYNISNSILDSFQLHDILSLQTATIGGFGIKNPFLCNGANLCYQKNVFIEVGGFKGNNAIASGDDLFLLEKIKQKYPENVKFLKTNHATVITKPESTLKTLLNQRVRWASKTSASTSIFNKALAFIVLIGNSAIIIGFIFALLQQLSWKFVFVIFILKFVVDFLFILKSHVFFKQKTNLRFYPINSLLYPFFVITISCYSVFFKYKWKDRFFYK